MINRSSRYLDIKLKSSIISASLSAERVVIKACLYEHFILEISFTKHVFYKQYIYFTSMCYDIPNNEGLTSDASF